MLSGKPLQQAAQQVTDAAYKPQFAALDQQTANTQTQYGALSQRGMDYYRQLAQEEARGVAREQALGQMLQGQQSAVGAQSQQAFRQMTADEQNRQQADAAVRGPGLGGGNDPTAQTIAATQGRAATLQQAAQNTSATQGANWASLMNAIAGAQQVHGQEMQGQVINREANLLGAIGQKRADLQGNESNDLTKNLLDLRQQGFTNLATMQGLGIKQSDLQAQIANQTANQRIASQRLHDARVNNQANRQVRQQSIDAANRRQDKSIAAANRRAAARGPGAKRPRTGLGSLTQSQENDAHAQISTAGQTIRQYAGKLSLDQLRQGAAQGFLTDATGKKLPLPKVKNPLFFEAALEIYHGGLTPATARQLQLAGLHIGGRYPVRPRPPQSAGAVGVTTPLG